MGAGLLYMGCLLKQKHKQNMRASHAGNGTEPSIAHAEALRQSMAAVFGEQ